MVAAFHHRSDAKYHSRSFLIGPPKPPPASYSLTTFPCTGTPRSFNACVRLLPCNLGPLPLRAKVPEEVLPPSRGTMLMRRPGFSCSADTPLPIVCSSKASWLFTVVRVHGPVPA